MDGTEFTATSDGRAGVGAFHLENPRLLRVAMDGDLLARQGAMVAYQGAMDFAYEGAGSTRRFLKRAFTSEGMSLMRVTGSGDLYLADSAKEIHLLELLGDDSVTVTGSSVLAFEPSLAWDIHTFEGASVISGGLFNTVFTGAGILAITAFGTPKVLRVDDGDTYTDVQSAIAWSSSLSTSMRKTARAGAVVGRGSGEAFQLAFSGSGYVVFQASEGRPPEHSHG
jgi:uncharacterized protein (AIM24 family)